MLTGESLVCRGAGRGAAVECLFEPVVGNALRAVGYGDRAALFESERLKRTSHRRVVRVCVAAQIVRMLRCKAENGPSYAVSAHRGHAVNDVVVGLGVPRAVDLGVGLVRPGSERKDGERPLVVGHKETVSARDVFFSINATRVSVGPLSRVPVRLHERPSMLIRALNELEVSQGSNTNPHASMIGRVGSVLARRASRPMGGSAG